MQALWMVVATFLFSAMGVCVKLLSGVYPTQEIVMYRSLIGAIFMFFLIIFRKGSFKTIYFWPHLWRGVIGVTAHGLWFYTIVFLPLATSMTLNYMSPIWIALILLGLGLYRKKVEMDWRLVGAILTSFIGLAILLRPTIQTEQWFAGVIGLISGALAAMAYLQVRHLGELGEPEDRVVFWFCVTGTICATIVCAIVAYLPGGDQIIFHAHDAYGLTLLIAIGVFAALAQMAMTRAYHLGRTLVTANLQYTGIVFSSIWGIVIWNDDIGLIGFMGIAIIILSGICATFFDVRRKMAKTQETYQSAKETLQK